MRSVCIHIGVVIIHRTKQFEVCMYTVTYNDIGINTTGLSWAKTP